MSMSLESMAIEMPAVLGHPNRIAFRGVLTFVDAVSDKAPAGARGHRVMLTRAAAEAGIPSLLGMALDYSPRLDGHDTRRKIGVITRAEIVGREITVGDSFTGATFRRWWRKSGRIGQLGSERERLGTSHRKARRGMVRRDTRTSMSAAHDTTRAGRPRPHRAGRARPRRQDWGCLMKSRTRWWRISRRIFGC